MNLNKDALPLPPQLMAKIIEQASLTHYISTITGHRYEMTKSLQSPSILRAEKHNLAVCAVNYNNNTYRKAWA